MPRTTPDQLLAPDGEVEPAFFPDEEKDDVLARLGNWLTRGWDNASEVTDDLALRDDAAVAFAYYRAYNGAHTTLLVTPSTMVKNDTGRQIFSPEQLKQLKAKADYWLAQYERIVPSAIAGTRLGATMQSVRSKFSF